MGIFKPAIILKNKLLIHSYLQFVKQPDTIAAGSGTVMIGGSPAARMGDSTAHGGVIIIGCPTVIIGG